MRIRWLYRSVSSRKVLFNLSFMLRLYGIISIPPVLFSAAYQEFTCTAIFAGTGLGAFLLGLFIYREAYSTVNNSEALVIVSLSYVIFSVCGALAFLPESSFLDGFFESMSGFTTTGLTMFDPETLPRSLVFFRSYSQWVGGAGIVILSAVILRIPARTAYRITSTETAGAGLLGSMKSISLLILKIYVVLTVIGFFALLAAGMDGFDSLIHVLSAISTGGFSSREASIGSYPSTAVRIAVTLVMVLGAVNFALYHHFRKRDETGAFFKDPQLRFLVALIIAGSALGLFSGTEGGLIDSLFQSATSLTTTGFNVRPVSDWPDSKKLLSSILMIIGGGDGSTAGGIKLFRFIILLYTARWFIRRSLLPPRSRIAVKYGRSIISNREMKEISAFFVIYLLVLSASTLLFTFSGHTAFDSFFESASSLGTVGLSSGITRTGLHPVHKIVLIFNMWAGRIEILPVLILFNPLIWKTRRRLS